MTGKPIREVHPEHRLSLEFARRCIPSYVRVGHLKSGLKYTHAIELDAWKINPIRPQRSRKKKSIHAQPNDRHLKRYLHAPTCQGILPPPRTRHTFSEYEARSRQSSSSSLMPVGKIICRIHGNLRNSKYKENFICRPLNLCKHESRYIYTYLLIFQHPLRNFMVRLAQWSCPSTNLHLAKSVPNRQSESGTKVWTIKCHSQHQTCHGSWWIRWPLHVFKKLIPWHIDLPRDPAPSSACLKQTGNYCSTDHFDVVDAGTSQCVFSSQCFSASAWVSRLVSWTLPSRAPPGPPLWQGQSPTWRDP